MRHDDSDVLIVGGGPAGSATALGLARLGWKVSLLDRATFPRDKACSEYTSPETLRHLDRLGVLGTLDCAGSTALGGTIVVAPGGPVLTGHFDRAGGRPFRPTGLALRRTLLDATLLDAARAAGTSVREATIVSAVTSLTDGRMSVGVREPDGSPSTHVARVIVGADGLRSVIARRTGLRRQGWMRRIAFVAHIRGVAGLGTDAELHVGPHGYVGLNPLGDGDTNVALVVPERIARHARGRTDAFFFEQLELIAGVRGRIDPGAVQRRVLVTGPFDAMSRRTVADGVLLVGDAADFFDPFTGEGICTALAGAELATVVLDDALGQRTPITSRHLAHYRTLRRRAFLGKWMIERMIGYAMLAPPLFDRAVSRLQTRGMADTLIGVTGNFVSPWKIMNPVALAKMIV